MKPCQATKTGMKSAAKRRKPPAEWSTTSSCESSVIATTKTRSKKSSSQLAWRSPSSAAVRSRGGANQRARSSALGRSSRRMPIDAEAMRAAEPVQEAPNDPLADVVRVLPRGYGRHGRLRRGCARGCVQGRPDRVPALRPEARDDTALHVRTGWAQTAGDHEARCRRWRRLATGLVAGRPQDPLPALRRPWASERAPAHLRGGR